MSQPKIDGYFTINSSTVNFWVSVIFSITKAASLTSTASAVPVNKADAVRVDAIIVSILSFETRCLISASSPV